MSSGASDITIRAFRDGDEAAACKLFNQFHSGFVGAAPTTPQSWRQQHQVSWRTPPLSQERECFRMAERNGEITAYAVVECPSRMEPDLAVIQELCVPEGEKGEELARLLVADAEQFARRRGAAAIVLHLSHEEGIACRIALIGGYQTPKAGPGVFMAVVTNLAAFLEEIAPELTNRLISGQLSDWQGVIRLASGDQSADLLLADRRVRLIDKDDGPTFSVEITPEALPLLLFGRVSVRDAFLQRWLSVFASDRPSALAVLDVLFPRLPIYLPSSQWW